MDAARSEGGAVRCGDRRGGHQRQLLDPGGDPETPVRASLPAGGFLLPPHRRRAEEVTPLTDHPGRATRPGSTLRDSLRAGPPAHLGGKPKPPKKKRSQSEVVSEVMLRRA